MFNIHRDKFEKSISPGHGKFSQDLKIQFLELNGHSNLFDLQRGIFFRQKSSRDFCFEILPGQANFLYFHQSDIFWTFSHQVKNCLGVFSPGFSPGRV